MFDTKSFLATQFLPREENVPVPDLTGFFDENEKSVFRVRGLTGQEVGVVNETEARNRKSLADAVEKLLVSLSVKDVESLSKKLNDPDRVTDDIARRLETLVLGSVSPEVNMELSIKICRVSPSAFALLTNAIRRLTGLGQEAKKSPNPLARRKRKVGLGSLLHE
ncbi:conserved hypothetical protein [delta proteobacterium NaphS2]|nr:conserved hypothetical protein [delta proteobacterium NaphS2]